MLRTKQKVVNILEEVYYSIEKHVNDNYAKISAMSIRTPEVVDSCHCKNPVEVDEP